METDKDYDRKIMERLKEDFSHYEIGLKEDGIKRDIIIDGKSCVTYSYEIPTAEVKKSLSATANMLFDELYNLIKQSVRTALGCKDADSN